MCIATFRICAKLNSFRGVIQEIRVHWTQFATCIKIYDVGQTQRESIRGILLINEFIACKLLCAIARSGGDTRDGNESYRFTTLSLPALADVNFASGRAQSNPSCHVSNNFPRLSKHTVHRSKLLSLL